MNVPSFRAFWYRGTWGTSECTLDPIFRSEEHPTKTHPFGNHPFANPRITTVSRAAKQGGFKRGRFPIWTCPSSFVLFCPFWDFPDFSGIFPICSGMVRGFSRLVLVLFLDLLRAPTRNSPERVRDTIWTFPQKSGKHPGLETPGFSFSQKPLKAPTPPTPWSALCLLVLEFCSRLSGSKTPTKCPQHVGKG